MHTPAIPGRGGPEGPAAFLQADFLPLEASFPPPSIHPGWAMAPQVSVHQQQPGRHLSYAHTAASGVTPHGPFGANPTLIPSQIPRAGQDSNNHLYNRTKRKRENSNTSPGHSQAMVTSSSGARGAGGAKSASVGVPVVSASDPEDRTSVIVNGSRHHSSHQPHQQPRIPPWLPHDLGEYPPGVKG